MNSFFAFLTAVVSCAAYHVVAEESCQPAVGSACFETESTSHLQTRVRTDVNLNGSRKLIVQSRAQRQGRVFPPIMMLVLTQAGKAAGAKIGGAAFGAFSDAVGLGKS